MLLLLLPTDIKPITAAATNCDNNAKKNTTTTMTRKKLSLNVVMNTTIKMLILLNDQTHAKLKIKSRN